MTAEELTEIRALLTDDLHSDEECDADLGPYDCGPAGPCWFAQARALVNYLATRETNRG